jgi:hypothetical protein
MKWQEAGENIMRSSIICTLPNICMIRSRRVEWVGHVAHMEEVDKCIQYFGWKVLREKTT